MLKLNKTPILEDSENAFKKFESVYPSLNNSIKGNDKKILIVDDNIFNLMAIEQTLLTTFPDLNFDKANNG
jgi:PleD family two-component response regulator